MSIDNIYLSLSRKTSRRSLNHLGLLPGVFREHLLQSVQKVQTGTITAGDLVEASKVLARRKRVGKEYV